MKPKGTTPETLRQALTDEAFLAVLERRLPRSRFAGETLLQETVMRGLEAEAQWRYDPYRGSPMTFLLAIARHVVHEHNREFGRARRAALMARETEDHDSPLERLVTQEQVEWVISQLSRLHPSDRALVCRRFGLWTEPGDSAPLTGSERCRLHRLLNELRRRLSSPE